MLNRNVIKPALCTITAALAAIAFDIAYGTSDTDGLEHQLAISDGYSRSFETAQPETKKPLDSADQDDHPFVGVKLESPRENPVQRGMRITDGSPE